MKGWKFSTYKKLIYFFFRYHPSNLYLPQDMFRILRTTVSVIATPSAGFNLTFKRIN